MKIASLVACPILLFAAADSMDQVRTEIVASYQRSLDALSRGDADSALTMDTSDWVSKVVGQQPRTRQELEPLIRRDIAGMKPPPGWIATWKPDYERNGTGSGIQVYDVKLQGDTAIVLCLVGNTREEMVDGAPRKVWTGSHVRDTWIKTPAGWKRRMHEKLTIDERMLDRDGDRAAIRAHIDRIFQAFIHKDSAELRATHAPNWLGYLEGSRQMIRGVDEYMEYSGYFEPGSSYGMKSYSMREFDMIFQGDAAFVAFVADVNADTPQGPSHRVLRITDFYTKQNGSWIQTGSDTDLHPTSAAERQQSLRTLSSDEKKTLLDARESVWRAYFAGDRATLEKLLPEELVTLEAQGNSWGNRKMVLDRSTGFAAAGGKLLRLEFPKSEIQVYGSTAIVYSNYLYEIEIGGKRSQSAGRTTEVFVNRNGIWVNPSWHMDAIH